jgi:hypothetical protein
MNFMEQCHYEFDLALRPSAFEKWAARVEKILGHDLDGDHSVDGYSLDDASDAFDSGMEAAEYAGQVNKGLRK